MVFKNSEEELPPPFRAPMSEHARIVPTVATVADRFRKSIRSVRHVLEGNNDDDDDVTPGNAPRCAHVVSVGRVILGRPSDGGTASTVGLRRFASQRMDIIYLFGRLGRGGGWVAQINFRFETFFHRYEIVFVRFDIYQFYTFTGRAHCGLDYWGGYLKRKTKNYFGFGFFFFFFTILLSQHHYLSFNFETHYR